VASTNIVQVTAAAAATAAAGKNLSSSRRNSSLIDKLDDESMQFVQYYQGSSPWLGDLCGDIWDRVVSTTSEFIP
jgi:hypothetical protein